MSQASTRSLWNWEFPAAIQLLLEAGVRALIELVIHLAARPRLTQPSAGHVSKEKCHLAAPQAEQGDRICDPTQKDMHRLAPEQAPRIVMSSVSARAGRQMTHAAHAPHDATGTRLPRLKG